MSFLIWRNQNTIEKRAAHNPVDALTKSLRCLRLSQQPACGLRTGPSLTLTEFVDSIQA